ncbi:MAG: cytochrome b N-terminal domain-containing protein [Deltaproteobacteria bacterium]|nr:cytochrome b N-terminal domain-containing protein [Deltaproteobacteria bacterium]MBW2112557.1 cytochrome b N-terminal domain-containing protein [Deltaproteobacteria bacterium]MBW2351702.1 cytochrome b N-terminal domain-containing protein [Deltaproteobacteria bacterium]
MSDNRKIVYRISSYLPRLGLASLALCLGSGIILVFYYRPMGNVFQNVEEITTLVPFGWFFRQLHYGSGQLFVILMLLHTLDHFLRKRYRIYGFKEWVFLISSLFLCFFVLFTGFVLKGDKGGLFAGSIFMNILQSIPVVGGKIAPLFIVPGKSFFFLPYLYHCFFLPVLIICLIRGHIREWFPGRGFLCIGMSGLFLYALLVRPAPDIPPEAAMAVVQGPWFFLGLQTLLRLFPVLFAGLVIPGLFTACLLLLPLLRRSSPDTSLKGRVARLGENGLHYLLVTALCLYGFLTLRAVL